MLETQIKIILCEAYLGVILRHICQYMLLALLLISADAHIACLLSIYAYFRHVSHYKNNKVIIYTVANISVYNTYLQYPVQQSDTIFQSVHILCNMGSPL